MGLYRLTQSFNPFGLLWGFYAILREPSLGIPNVHVKNIFRINPEKLIELGFRYAVFDKDNVLTKTYGMGIHEDVRDAFDWFKEVYGKRLVIVTNSAGTSDDFGYEKKKKIENVFGIPVLAHKYKKPHCGLEIAEHFSELTGGIVSLRNAVMFGDRIGTDVMLGSLNEMFTVHTAPFSTNDELMTVRMMRSFENWCVRYFEKSYGPKSHQNITLEQVIYTP